MSVGVEKYQRSLLDTLTKKPNRLVFEELPTGSTVWETGEITPPGVNLYDSAGILLRGIRILDQDTISVNHGALVGSGGFNLVDEYKREKINIVKPDSENVPRLKWRHL